MKTHILFAITLVACAFRAEVRAQTTAFIYQGRLNQNSAPATGLFDVRFTLFGEATNGSPVSSRITHSAVGVTNGLFTVPLDFSADPFTGANRWLDIEVRTAGGGTFTLLTPRQPLTPTPYAVTALTALTAKQVPGVSGNALHAVDGSPQNAVFVNNDGNVGIGTTSPQERFDLRSGDGSYLRVDIENGDIKANGGTDGHFGIFNDGPAAGGTHLIGEGLSRLFVANTGNVGIGTFTPAAKLDVQGEVRMGPGGRLLAAGGDQALRILQGSIDADGSVVFGAGFSSVRLATGGYRVKFVRNFEEGTAPVVIANVAGSSNDNTPLVAMFGNANNSSVDIDIRRTSNGDRVARYFNFMVIGKPE